MLAAARMREGLVVASVGLNLAIAERNKVYFKIITSCIFNDIYISFNISVYTEMKLRNFKIECTYIFSKKKKIPTPTPFSEKF